MNHPLRGEASNGVLRQGYKKIIGSSIFYDMPIEKIFIDSPCAFITISKFFHRASIKNAISHATALRLSCIERKWCVVDTCTSRKVYKRTWDKLTKEYRMRFRISFIKANVKDRKITRVSYLIRSVFNFANFFFFLFPSYYFIWFVKKKKFNFQ